MGRIFYIMGKSASGKDKIYGKLSEEPELKLQNLVLYTTRPIRHNEEDGKQYFFVQEEKLNELRKRNKIIEERSYDTIHGIWTYFTADDGQVHLKDENYLGIGTLESYHKLREYYGAEFLCPIYVEVEDGIRLERALKREQKQAEPKYAEMCRRFLADCEDFSDEKIAQEGIVKRFLNNGELDVCLEEIRTYISENLR